MIQLDKKFLKRFKSDPKLAVHCPTKKDATTFCNWLESNGITWCDGISYTGTTDWAYYGSCTAYSNAGRYGSIGFYKEQGYTVVEFNAITLRDALDEAIHALATKHLEITPATGKLSSILNRSEDIERFLESTSEVVGVPDLEEDAVVEVMLCDGAWEKRHVSAINLTTGVLPLWNF